MITLLCLLALAAPPDRVDRLMQQGEVVRAERVADRWVKRRPTADALLARARTREAAGRLHEAVGDRIAALQLAPERAGTVAARTAELLVVLGRDAEARDWALRAVQDDTDASGDQRSRNRLMAVTLLGDEADLALLDEAVALAESDEQRARAYASRADRTGDISDALEARRLAPPDSRVKADALQATAAIAWADGDLNSAEIAQTRAVAILTALLTPGDPSLSSAWESWAAIAETQGRHADAIERLQSAMPADRQTPTLLLALARNFDALHQADNATTYYEAADRAATADGNFALAARAKNGLGVALFARGELERARDVFQAALDDIAQVPELPPAAAHSVQVNLDAVQAELSATNP